VRSIRLIATSLAIFGLAATPSLAADPAQDGYSTMPIESVPPPTVKGASATRAPASASLPASGSSVAPIAATTAPTSAGGSLPFTGLDVGIIAGAAVLLLGLGFALRRGVRTD
jgi:hypothetical protein